MAASGVLALLAHAMSDGGGWSGPGMWGVPGLAQFASARRSWMHPTERAYAAASSDYVKDARRVMEALRRAAEDEPEGDDPLASGWDDVVRRPSIFASLNTSWAPETLSDGEPRSATPA